MHTTKSLRNFIEGKRNFETKWCDWAIPLHWGGTSDPFQACELEHKCSLECLEIFAETKYPFIVSTKNPVMLTKEPYLSLISQCRCVLQVSMGCGKYDKLEQGAPTYEERLQAVKFLSDKVTRIIARVRPYFFAIFAIILVCATARISPLASISPQPGHPAQMRIMLAPSALAVLQTLLNGKGALSPSL